MKINYLLLGVLLVVQLFCVWQWSLCGGFPDGFRFSQYDLELRLIEGIHNDTNQPLWAVRAFHNKVIGTSFDLFGAYLQFWNPIFLAHFISLVGIVGLGAGLYSFLSQKKKRLSLWFLFGYLLVAPFIKILGSTSLPYVFSLGFIATPFIIWSVYGYWYLLKEKKISIWWIIVLLVVSFWYQLILLALDKLCVV